MIIVFTETRTVYRSSIGRRARFKKRTAYLDAAWQAWRAAHPCLCERETGFVCGEHLRVAATDDEAEVVDPEIGAHRRKVIDRLARWLMWRDGKRNCS